MCWFNSQVSLCAHSGALLLQHHPVCARGGHKVTHRIVQYSRYCACTGVCVWFFCACTSTDCMCTVAASGKLIVIARLACVLLRELRRVQVIRIVCIIYVVMRTIWENLAVQSTKQSFAILTVFFVIIGYSQYRHQPVVYPFKLNSS